MIKRIINKIIRTIDEYKNLKSLNAYFQNKSGIYEFSRKDLDLYKIETKTKLFPKKTKKINDNLSIVSILKHEIYWPNNVSDSDLPWLYHEIFDSYESNPSSYNHPNICYQDADWVIDAGCCEGYFSLFVYDNNKTCSVFALEPLKEMKESLLRTFKTKIEQNKFNLISKALGKEPGKAKFSCDDNHLCDSSITNNNNTQSYEVEITSLDILIKENNLTENGIIKMDIEGAEMDALKGGCNIMKKYKPMMAIAVYHDYENAIKCRNIILKANPEYKTEFRGMYGYFSPPRPYILFAW